MKVAAPEAARFLVLSVTLTVTAPLPAGVVALSVVALAKVAGTVVPPKVAL